MNKYQIKMKAEHKCIICGKVDERTLSGKTTCNICFGKQKENRICRKPRMKRHQIVSTMDKLYKLARLATAEGLSYGQYVAKHRYDNRISNETNEKEIK